MRKWFISFIVTGLFLLSMTTSQAFFDGIRLGDFPRTSQLYQSLKNIPSQSLNNIIVLPKKIFDQHEAAAIINRIAALPNSILYNLYHQGISLKLFTGKLTDNPTARQLAGQIPRGYQINTTWDDVPGIGGGKTVLVKIGFSEKGKGHGSVNLELHELAHSIDKYVFNNISQTKVFKQVWEKEHDQLFSGNSYFLYPEEYFAETFAMFYLNDKTRNQLKLKAPLTFKLISNLS
ncbi:anthrax toxin lethal factor-related metalloendopeptidase [Neobacillus mesonae]|uniref:anthrax toxin lethal factor-related metalloendopeptidase n=1 Tax=Neobacillus mesonae TaxID=1193713 RepID=UPI00203D2BD0|nr:toxin [Neobacillus mesonae]MCM3566888.1 toxin [Neobacillus mesonae]